MDIRSQTENERICSTSLMLYFWSGTSRQQQLLDSETSPAPEAAAPEAAEAVDPEREEPHGERSPAAGAASASTCVPPQVPGSSPEQSPTSWHSSWPRASINLPSTDRPDPEGYIRKSRMRVQQDQCSPTKTAAPAPVENILRVPSISGSAVAGFYAPIDPVIHSLLGGAPIKQRESLIQLSSHGLNLHTKKM